MEHVVAFGCRITSPRQFVKCHLLLALFRSCSGPVQALLVSFSEVIPCIQPPLSNRCGVGVHPAKHGPGSAHEPHARHREDPDSLSAAAAAQLHRGQAGLHFGTCLGGSHPSISLILISLTPVHVPIQFPISALWMHQPKRRPPNGLDSWVVVITTEYNLRRPSAVLAVKIMHQHRLHTGCGSRDCDTRSSISQQKQSCASVP